MSPTLHDTRKRHPEPYSWEFSLHDHLKPKIFPTLSLLCILNIYTDQYVNFINQTCTMTISIIDSSIALVSFLNDLESQPINPPSLYLDIEGVALSRHGSISIIQLFHLPQNQVFLIDIFVLQEAAFNTPNQSGTTLRSILESALVFSLQWTK